MLSHSLVGWVEWRDAPNAADAGVREVIEIGLGAYRFGMVISAQLSLKSPHLRHAESHCNILDQGVTFGHNTLLNLFFSARSTRYSLLSGGASVILACP